MAVYPSHFKDNANQLARDYTTEIGRRSAISRGYYWAFHYIRSNARTEFSYFGDGRDHGRNEEFLRNKDKDNLADTYGDLREIREYADYHTGRNIDQVDLETFMEELDEFMDQVTEFL